MGIESSTFLQIKTELKVSHFDRYESKIKSATNHLVIDAWGICVQNLIIATLLKLRG